ncbi:PH domain-containing protein [Rhodococcus sp. HNM0569]|uniref:PH domain-containing protein n=1 Tax=Rhodococcus sp. HNM0569 TaxID=2716340 RepID=UPI00146C941A|nr:PH domain-containing protein [Rhodococcus sp. HNM0569]NLU83848.1 PH domain-containing protein [Rhodococcus sp. HNM0569]
MSTEHLPPVAPRRDETPESLAAEAELPWRRLDARMLLVHPVTEAVKLLPVLVVSVVVGSQSGNHTWGLVALAVLVALGLSRWFTTTYRIGPVHVQLRRGLLRRRTLSVPRSRIRSVDVEATALHRLLGLSVVRIGTGRHAGAARGASTFELDALGTAVVPALRRALLDGGPHEGDPHEPLDGDAAPAEQGLEIGHWSPGWVRYAPFSLTGLVTIGALIGVLFQYGLGERLLESGTIGSGLDAVRSLGVAVAVAAGLVALWVAASVVACVAYLVAFGNMTVVDDGRTIVVSHGLVKTRQVTLTRDRLRGATLKEPLLLRLVGGARLDAIMTGVSASKGQSSLLLPQGPAAEAARVMNIVIGGGRQPAMPLVRHGRAAARRRFVRALAPAALALAVALGYTVFSGPPPAAVWITTGVLFAGGAALAWDRYRGLGHAVAPGWLVTRNGSLDRTRDSLDADGIIGWTVRQSLFQRRAGVATVVAATPAGTGSYRVVDLPADDAWSLVEAVTPGATDRWGRP